MSSFDEDLKFAEKFMPVQDKLYKRLFRAQSIQRSAHGEQQKILDRLYHIDVEIEQANGQIILGQEKVLRFGNAEHNTFTIEFYQNRATKERGEFFAMAPHFYLHGYSNEEETAYLKWYLIDWFRFTQHMNTRTLEQLESRTAPAGTSNASFLHIPYDELPPDSIFACEKGPHIDFQARRMVRLQKAFDELFGRH